MAHSPTARKRVRQNRERRLRNRHHRSRLRGQVRRVREAVTAEDAELTKAELPRAIAMLDRMAGRGIVHRNAAARAKSRLARLARPLLD